MNRTTIFFIAVGVLALHGALFWLIANEKVLPKTPFVPRPNFVSMSSETTDPETGGKVIYREFTVSTKFLDPQPLPDSAP